MTEQRDLDVVVFGATGFVGRLIAQYLAEHAPDGVRIGLAGRSEAKLARVRAELPASADAWPLIAADSSDRASLDALARRTRVVATTVGPYFRAGLPLVEACADAGTHYADLTGEVLFIHEALRHHDRAAASGARIVNSTGFDSIPSDLGVLLLHQAAAADGDGRLGRTRLVVKAMRGGASGGTVASLKGQVDEIRRDPASRKIVTDPFALCPERPDDAARHGDSFGVHRDEELGVWVAPFVMATFNTRVVRRSNALQDWAYGRDFDYSEVMSVGSGITAPAKAAAVAGGLGALAGGLAFRPTRAILDRVLPDPGEGPSEKSRRRGFFTIELHAETPDGRKYRSKVAAQGDPGYNATAMMMGETALCLALHSDRLPGRAGVLTPASGIGQPLVDRLRSAGMTLEVERA
jgi:short subunit dehydrogenase-like uncharacterized protein